MSKDHIYNFIYKTVNLKNQKFYIGMHSTSDLSDGYIGSGRRLRNSVRYWGKDNHSFEILEFLPDRKSLSKREREIINEELLKDPKCMNIALGGEAGGFINESHMKKCCQAGNQKFKELLKNPEYKKEFTAKSKGAETWKRLHAEGRVKYDTFTGKSHTEEAKKSTGEKNSINQQGVSNSQFGKIWIRNMISKETLKINGSELEQYLSIGWERGRLIDVPRVLTEEIVREIKIKLSEGLDCVKISKLFSTTPSTVKSIKWGNSWNHVKL